MTQTANHASLDEARRLKVARLTSLMANITEDAPPITASQRARLSALLRGGATS